jgi:hypothetical protein
MTPSRRHPLLTMLLLLSCCLLLQLSDDQRRGLRKYLLAVTSCPQRAATFVGAQYPLLVDSQEWGQEELVDSLATLAGPMLT